MGMWLFGRLGGGLEEGQLRREGNLWMVFCLLPPLSWDIYFHHQSIKVREDLALLCLLP